MDIKRFLEIMNDDEAGGEKMFAEKGCNAVKGLLILQKYLPLSGIEGANHDVIYSVSVEKIVEAGITEEDAVELRAQNWMAEDDEVLACFV
jgi:hypothetical protein